MSLAFRLADEMQPKANGHAPGVKEDEIPF
jgi:hypothetical protein